MDEDTRAQLGETVRTERAKRGMSVEAAAKAGGVGHMTFRKVEQGKRVYEQTYAAVDRAFGWPAGTTLNAARHDGTIPNDADPSSATHPDDSTSRLRIVHKRHSPREHDPDESRHEDPHTLALDLASAMTVAELQAASDTYTRLAEDIREGIGTISEKLSSGMETELIDAMTRDERTAHSIEFVNTYRRYMETFVAMSDMRVHLYQQLERPVGEVDLNALHERADSLRATLARETDALTHLHNQIQNAEKQGNN